MDDYIFLIIAVAISIFAAIKKNKKKEEAKPVGKNPEKPGHFLFDQLLPEEVKAEIADEFDFPDWPEETVTPEPVKAPEPAMMYQVQNATSGSGLPEQKKSNIKLSVKKSVQEEEVFEQEEGSGYLEDFSLRKAIIYSEILKPKFKEDQATLF